MRSVAHHVGVIEETVVHRGGPAELTELREFFAGIAVLCTGPAVQSKILHLTGQRRWRLEWIHDVHQVEFLAERSHLLRLPSTARFPAKLKLTAFSFFKKTFHPGNVLAGRRETGRTLEDDKGRIKFTRHGKCFVPRPPDCGVETEMATVLPVMVIERRVPVGRTGSAVGDNLPSFHGKSEPSRRSSAPTGGSRQFGQPIETGVNLDAREFPEILGLGKRKAAATGMNRWRLCAHA